MKHLARTTLSLSLVVLLASSLLAAEKENKGKGKKKKPKALQAVKVPKGIELNEEQKTQLAVLNTQYGPKLTELRLKQKSILTEDQKKARAAAAKALKESGIKGKEARKALNDAIQLTDEQKKQTADLRKEMGSLQKEIRGKVMALLTDDQKAQLKSAKEKAKAEKKKKASSK